MSIFVCVKTDDTYKGIEVLAPIVRFSVVEATLACLREFYSNQNEVEALLAMGNARCLAPSLGTRHSFDEAECYRDLGISTFYKRDRGAIGADAASYTLAELREKHFVACLVYDPFTGWEQFDPTPQPVVYHVSDLGEIVLRDAQTILYSLQRT